VSIEHNFLPVQEYRCTLCGVKLEFFHRKYDEGMIGARHPKRGKCSRQIICISHTRTLMFAIVQSIE